MDLLREVIGDTVGVLVGDLVGAHDNAQLAAGLDGVGLALLLVFVMRPAMFFAKGGIRNGTPIMFLMGAYYLIIVQVPDC